MKRILLDETKPFFKANMHCHTVCSDGQKTPTEIKAHYKANGYSIVAFTDHEHLLDHSDLNDDAFLAITGCELGIKEFETLSTLKKTDMKVCHLNLYARDPHNIDTPCYSTVYDHYRSHLMPDQIVHSCGEYQRHYSATGINEMIRLANEKGFLVCYNHPQWSLENARDYLAYQGLWAVEMYNHSSACMGIYEYNAHVYDDFLRDGQRLGCVAGDDNHTERDMCGGFTVINADELTYPAVIQALEEYRFYTSTGPCIHGLYCEEETAVITVSKARYVTMTTKGRRAQRKPVDGVNTLTFTIKPNEDGYIRFDVVDEHGNRANTCAYWL